LATQLHAKRYAEAIFEIARKSEQLEGWESDLEKIAILAEEPELKAVMENPKPPYEMKSKLVEQNLLEVGPLAMNLVHLLITKGKFSLLPEILREYRFMLGNYRGIVKAEVTTAVSLDEIEKEVIQKRLEAISGNKIILTTQVDPSIIGGIVARVGGRLIDGSTRSRLIALKNELAETKS
jgi:F-type H+-transporting ATPase subunit delta